MKDRQEVTGSMAAVRAIVEKLGNSTEGVVICFGYAPIVPELARKLAPEYEIVVYDPDPPPAEGFPARVREAYIGDLSFLEDYRTRIANGQSLIVKHNPTVARHPDEYAEFERRLKEQAALAQCSTSTAVAMGRHFVGAYLENVPEIIRRPGVKALAGVMSGCAALVVGPGPSLARAADALREVEAKVLVIAVDAALPYLRGIGVVPDIIAAIDPVAENANFFGRGDDIEFWSGSVLVALAQYTPDVVRRFPGPVFLSASDGNIVDAWLKPYWGDKGAIEAFGGSVSHFGFAIAEYLGCSPVGLVGQDLCWQDHYYAPGVLRALLGDGAAEPDPATTGTVAAINNRGEPCRTNGILRIFRTSWQNKLRNCATPARQCSDGGLSIDGAADMALEAFVQKFSVSGEAGTIRADLHAAYDAEMARPGQAPNVIELRAEIARAIALLDERRRLSAKILALLRREEQSRSNPGLRLRILKKISAANSRVPHPVLNLAAAYHYGLELYLAREATKKMGEADDPAAAATQERERAQTYYRELQGALNGLLPVLRNLERLLRG